MSSPKKSVPTVVETEASPESPRKNVRVMKPIKIPIIKRSFKHGLVMNAVQFKNEIFSPFKEKRKEIKLRERYGGQKIKPKISEFEVNLLNEFIENRFGLAKKMTAYDILIARAMRASEDQLL